MSRKTYRVEITREGRWWNAYVPEIDYTTQGRHISEVEEMARDLIASAQDVPADSFDLDVRITEPDDVARVPTA